MNTDNERHHTTQDEEAASILPILDPARWWKGKDGVRVFETEGDDRFTVYMVPKVAKGGKEITDWLLEHRQAGSHQGMRYQLGEDTYDSFEEFLEGEEARLIQLFENAAPPVTDLAAVLSGMVEEIQRPVVLDPFYAEAIALWVLHALGIDACQFSPRLHIRSPVPECGKSTLLEIIEAFCKVRDAEIISSITPAAYFRSVHKASLAGGHPPIMLLDERDSFLNDESRKDAFSILNSGHKRKGARVNRCDLSANGPYEANSYVTWAPCVLAGIGGFGNSHQANALESRCININLKRKREKEHAETFGSAAEARCIQLGRQAAAWCQKNVARLVEEYPETPGLYNREADSWRMLFKFGDAAGGRWPELARQTALAIKHGVSDDPGEGVMLLQDIKAAFEKAGASRLTTASLLAELHNCIERPWGKRSLSDVEPVFQERQLAAALRPYGIKAKQLRMGTENRRGFLRDQFDDAWSRYLREEEGHEDVADAEAA
jgi:hypothetical protein